VLFATSLTYRKNMAYDDFVTSIDVPCLRARTGPAGWKAPRWVFAACFSRKVLCVRRLNT
jgi:hypothetical protein